MPVMPISRPSLVPCPLLLASCPLRLFLLALGLFLPACALIPAGLQLPTFSHPSPEAMQARLLHIAYPLLIASADWCPFDQELTYGFLLRDEAGTAWPEPHSAQGRAVVAYVHPRLPAALAGLSVGDVLTHVNTVNVTGDSSGQVGQLINRLTRAKIQPLQLEILKDGEPLTIAMSAILACHYAMQVLNSDLINGITDGRRIGVTSGALKFFPSDDELGWVVAHEIAHNILSHVQNAKLQAMLRTFLAARGEVSGSTENMFPRPSLESQADYVGAYLMARAGYDLSAIKRVWERLVRVEARQGGQKPSLAQTHPPTKERLAAFEVTLQEIESKRQAGQLLDFRIEEDH